MSDTHFLPLSLFLAPLLLLRNHFIPRGKTIGKKAEIQAHQESSDFWYNEFLPFALLFVIPFTFSPNFTLLEVASSSCSLFQGDGRKKIVKNFWVTTWNELKCVFATVAGHEGEGLTSAGKWETSNEWDKEKGFEKRRMNYCWAHFFENLRSQKLKNAKISVFGIDSRSELEIFDSRKRVWSGESEMIRKGRTGKNDIRRRNKFPILLPFPLEQKPDWC